MGIMGWINLLTNAYLLDKQIVMTGNIIVMFEGFELLIFDY
jgi:hypothetical protein